MGVISTIVATRLPKRLIAIKSPDRARRTRARAEA
jgi:hypothetical protein